MERWHISEGMVLKKDSTGKKGGQQGIQRWALLMGNDSIGGDAGRRMSHVEKI